MKTPTVKLILRWKGIKSLFVKAMKFGLNLYKTFNWHYIKN